MADTGKNTCKFEGLDWAWAQLAKHLLPKHEDMSLILGEHVKMPGKWVHICNPTVGGHGGNRILRAHWQAKTTILSSSGPMGDLV